MKKLLTILILLLAVVTQGRATTKVEKILWDNSISEYTDGVELNAATVATFVAGDVLRVYVTVPEGGANFKIFYKGESNGWAETAIPSVISNNEATQWPWVNEGSTYYDVTLTAADITAFSGKNIYIYKGDNSTITKVSLIKGEEITCPDLTNLKIGDEVTVKYNKPEDGSQLIIKVDDSVNEVEPYKTNSTDETYTFDTFVVTEEICDNIKAGGLVLECSRNSNNQNSTIIFNEITLVARSNIMGAYSSSTLEAKSVSMSNVSLQTGYRLKVSKVNKNSNESLVISYTDGSTSTEIYTLENNDTEIEITDANISNIQSNGLILTGNDLALTKVELIASSHETDNLSSSQFTKLWSTTSGNPASTIEFSSTWGGAGWNIGDDKYNAAQSITVALSDAPTTPLNLVLEYVTTDGAVLTNTSNYGNSADGFTASSTVSVPQSDLLKIRKLYIQNPDATTTITLSSVKIATSVLNNDMSVYEVASSVFSSALVGDKIKITYSSISSGDMNLKVGTTDGGEDVLASGTVTGISKEIEITASTLAAIKSNGLYLRGNNITIESVELVSVPPFTGDDDSKTANLARFVADGEGANYDGNGTITTTAGYKGVKLTLSEGQYVSGTRLIVNFQSATNAKVHVNYVGKSWGDGSENTGNGTQLIVPLNISNQVSEVIIQIATAGTATLTGVSVDNKCMLTTTAVNGSIGMTYTTGGADATGTEFPYGTELTLTATASDGYTFLKWQKNGEDVGTDETLSIMMSANTEITALFQLEYEAKSTLFTGSVDINWSGVAIQPSTVGAILEAGEQLILTTTVAEGAYGQVAIRGADRTNAIEGSAIGGLVNGENVITLTSAMVEAMREEFGFWGEKATLTKVVLYKPDVIFVDGEANLERGVEVGDKTTFTAQHDEAITGNVLVVESNENATVKVTFSDNTTATNKPGDRKIGNPTGSQALVLLDRSKFIKTIEIDKAKDAITKIYMSSLTLFEKSGEDYIADLSLAKAMDNTTFDTSSYTIATTVAWSGGIQLDVLEGETVKGKELMIQTESDADLKVTVEYESGDKTEVQDRPASKEMKVVIDGNRAVKQILIQPKTASVTKLLKVAVNASATPDPNVFSKDDKGNFVADLSMVKAEGATYNNTTFTMVATDNWQGVTVTPGNAEVVKGKELYIEFDKAALGYAKISYVDDETSVEGGLDAAGTVMKIALDDSKQISKIEIKLKEAGTAKFKKIAVNATETADESGDDDEETVIDEETGEADLTELTAQDDTKTTLTENEDGSITMTTTEAYCAAQIWFNDPEPVAGNVLKVELAESKVNVTVTVKYTDGTESQMSANTKAVVSARATTRAVASGTTIEVPLETGKEVQNIEVKNNEAGTITIKKMQVTTINVFTGGVANLSMLKPQSNATYDTAAHTLATTKGWTGATVSPVAGENVSGKELLIEFADASKVKVSVKYRTDVEGPSTIMEKAAKAVRLALDNTKNIQEISIQPTEAAIVTFTKIAVNSEESDDGSLKPGKTITLWESATGETLSWNEVAKQDASVGEMLQEYDELLITVSGVVKDCDWPKVFIRDASSEQAGNEVLLNDVGSFPYTVRIVLTGEMAQQLQKGFSICGDGVTVTKLQVYRPEAPKTGDIHLADLNYGYNSSYDKGSHTITTTARWAARGWEIGDKRYNDKNLITVKFEAVDFPVTLKMEYTTGLQTAQATSVGVPAGRTELLLEIPKGISKLNRVYIIYENPGSVKLTEASVTYMENLKLSTAIQAFEADGVIRDGRYDTDGWYNLRGMRIPEPTTSGIYIHGGKKVVIY